MNNDGFELGVQSIPWQQARQVTHTVQYSTVR
jgi:hypothetical protein